MLFVFVTHQVTAQDPFAKPVKIAVFAPLYLNEAFEGSIYKFSKSTLPKTLLPGLEFYHGVMMAVETLAEEGMQAEILVYDSKQTAASLSYLFSSSDFTNTGLIIASITNPAELKLFADQALSKHIPLISATYPNYVGINGNPFFVLINSSLQAHLEGLYKHMQSYYTGNTIVAIRKPGAVENYIQSTITDLNKKTSSIPLKIKWVTLNPATFSATELTTKLDSMANNVVFVASPTEDFGLKVVRTINTASNYRVTAIGMPTWDGIKELDKNDCRNVDIVYSTPFYFLKDGLANEITALYKSKYGSRPSDMVFKGYESTLHFGKLLMKHRHNLVNNLNDKEFVVFNQFDLQPVQSKKVAGKPDYLENKKLYFVKKQNGNVKSVITN
ncbi:MAG: hypothetical protein JWQ96_3155 [Segetibacter sp.]|nr:hypothetical protein [Segetibacter sp.]